MKQLIDGLEIVGKTKDSGYANPIYLIRTKNNTFIQLTQLLFNTVVALKHHHDLHTVAKKLTALQKQEIDEQAVKFLIEKKLEPLGIVKDTHTIFDARRDLKGIQSPELLLGLRYKTTLLSEETVRAIAQIFTPLFWPPVMAILAMCIIFLNIWLFIFHGISQAVQQTINEPFLFLLILGLLLLSTLFHEFGHAAACIYGGGKPGKIGTGLYLVWPAFFTDISDVYRLDRIAKLRSDLGGVYFNLIFSLGIAGAYVLTHFQPLLLLIGLQNIEVLHQLLPFVRLDGYFIVSDIVGLPDLFMRIGPILKSFLPGQNQNTTHDLKPWVKWTVTLWVLVTVPILAYILTTAIINAPHIFVAVSQSAMKQITSITTSVAHAQYLLGFIGLLQLIILLFPALGMVYLIIRFSKIGLSWIYTFAGESFQKKILITVGLVCEASVILYFILFMR